MNNDVTNLTYLITLELFAEDFIVQPNKIVGINFQEIDIYFGYLIAENGMLLSPVFVKEEDYFKIDHTFPYIFYTSINLTLNDYKERILKVFEKNKEKDKKDFVYYILEEKTIINNNVSKFRH